MCSGHKFRKYNALLALLALALAQLFFPNFLAWSPNLYVSQYDFNDSTAQQNSKSCVQDPDVADDR